LLAKLRLKPSRGSASLDCCLLALAPLGRHLLRASETCFIRHDVGLRRCQVDRNGYCGSGSQRGASRLAALLLARICPIFLARRERADASEGAGPEYPV